MTDYEAARKRVERFRNGRLAWLIYNVSPDTSEAMDHLRADLNLIAGPPEPSVEEVARVISSNPAYLAEVRDEQQTWLADHLAQALYRSKTND